VRGKPPHPDRARIRSVRSTFSHEGRRKRACLALARPPIHCVKQWPSSTRATSPLLLTARGGRHPGSRRVSSLPPAPSAEGWRAVGRCLSYKCAPSRTKVRAPSGAPPGHWRPGYLRRFHCCAGRAFFGALRPAVPAKGRAAWVVHPRAVAFAASRQAVQRPPSASSWQAPVVGPGGAPAQPECAGTFPAPAGAAQRSALSGDPAREPMRGVSPPPSAPRLLHRRSVPRRRPRPSKAVRN
jgi:hypothetical protein